MKKLLKRIYINLLWVFFGFLCWVALGWLADLPLVQFDRKELIAVVATLFMLTVADYARDAIDKIMDQKGEA